MRRSLSKLLLLLVAACVLLLAVLPASAAVVFSNISGTTATGDFLLDGLNITSRAVGFTVPAGGTYRLNSATLRVTATIPFITGSATVSVYTNGVGNVPGTLVSTLGTLSAPCSSIPCPTSNLTVTSTSGVPLAGGSSYWLVLQSGRNLSMQRTTAGFSGPFTLLGQKAISSLVSGWQTPLLGGSFKVSLDADAPVSISSITCASASPTNAASVSWNVTLGGSVSGLTTSNFALAQTGVSGATITGISGSGANYVVTASTGTGDGSIGLNLANSTNLLPGISTALPFTGGTCSIDKTAPTVSISSSASPGPTSTSPIPMTVNFSESVAGFDPATEIVITNGTASNFAGTPATVTFDLTPSASGPITVNIAANVATDGAGNGNTAATQFSITYDSDVPTATISSAASNPTSTSPIPVTVTFSEAVTGFDLSDVTVGNGAAGNFAGSGTLYSFDITPTGAGVVTVDVPANAAQDSASNGNSAAAQFSITYDSDAPGVVISSTASNPTNITPIPVTITFSEDVTGFDAADVVVGNGTAGVISGGPAVYTLNVTPSAFGTVTIDVVTDAVLDSANNGNTAAAQFSIVYDSAAAGGIIILYVPNDGTDAVTTIPNPLGGAATFAIVSGGGTVDPTTGAFWYDVLPGAAPGDIYVTVLITSGAQSFEQIVQIVVMAAPPPVPLCEDHNFDEGGIVRSGAVNDATAPFINCRVLYQNGAPTTWLGSDLYGAGNLGVPGLIELGVQQAVDIFSPSGLGYFEGGAVFCLRGAGTLIWLDGNQAPKTAEIIGSYSVPEFAGFTCATLFEPGTLVLVSQNPMQ